ncbi:carboxylating nicotinate-nucleotide diphosphorylase [Pedobacter flavus]|uniref:nicotinate-nucleotide diphosphorylase (carboxylating) n=1 Tax=Pedobacter flavus TaxID=3113906 RepID=A0ABU7GXQ3_9SPHI|nr:carboxylating nicotinate-nucleotide diphosphorylase [Pedobacter sp. VNH31]MEE1883837.1 carboxylating nicotinate-nucleotide diphosphorylase [Pedobacter sp. VNH31]
MSSDLNLKDFIKNAIAEDVGDGDHTALSTIPLETQGKAKLLVKEAGILAGVELALEIFNQIDSKLQISTFFNDGDEVKVNDVVFIVSGSTHSILLAERLVLNCMQRMSGIATLTNRLVKLVKPFGVKLLDTRKTTPGLRMLEKWAVRIGGGVNHRMGLYDMILIKDNHVDYAGGIKQAINAANLYLKENHKNLEIEIEVRNMQELNEALEVGNIQRIMLDNFSPEVLTTAVKLINNRFKTEASGGITESNILEYAKTGVNYISMGALTHSIKSLDLSLKAI